MGVTTAWKAVRSQWIGILALAVALGGVGAAATGKFAILGASNTADRTTTFANTGDGPVLRLQGSGGPPFVVNSVNQVRNLNASLLRGKKASDFLSSKRSHLIAMDGLGTTADGFEYRRTFTAPGPGTIIITIQGMCRVNDANPVELVLSAKSTKEGADWYPSTGPRSGDGIDAAEPILTGCMASIPFKPDSARQFRVRLEAKPLGGGQGRIEGASVFVWYDERFLH